MSNCLRILLLQLHPFWILTLRGGFDARKFEGKLQKCLLLLTSLPRRFWRLQMHRLFHGRVIQTSRASDLPTCVGCAQPCGAVWLYARRFPPAPLAFFRARLLPALIFVHTYHLSAPMGDLASLRLRCYLGVAPSSPSRPSVLAACENLRFAEHNSAVAKPPPSPSPRGITRRPPPALRRRQTAPARQCRRHPVVLVAQPERPGTPSSQFSLGFVLVYSLCCKTFLLGTVFNAVPYPPLVGCWQQFHVQTILVSSSGQDLCSQGARDRASVKGTQKEKRGGGAPAFAARTTRPLHASTWWRLAGGLGQSWARGWKHGKHKSPTLLAAARELPGLIPR